MPLSDEGQPGTGSGRLGLLVKADIAPVVKRDAPAVDRRSSTRAALGESIERERRARRLAAYQTKQLAYARLSVAAYLSALPSQGH